MPFLARTFCASVGARHGVPGRAEIKPENLIEFGLAEECR